MARIDAEEKRRLAAAERGGAPISGRRAAYVAGALLVVAVLVLAFLQNTGEQHSPAAGMTATSGQAISLRDGMHLSVPVGAITGDKPVAAAYADQSPWDRHSPVSAPVDFSTSGEVIGRPVPSLQVPEALREAAAQGSVQVAYRSDDPSGWTEHPATYNRETHVLEARLEHFSTWQFWTWDWVSIGAGISQAAGEWTSRRSSDMPKCDSGIAKPAWFNFEAGMTDGAAMVIRSCAQGRKQDVGPPPHSTNNHPPHTP
ncbi:hypothetical protein JNUCC0626_47275 [Lentzea sp. JNUCC 0626]|uniref:hypothetical protein n=1 Tax=Lentzea sp. JNUCC 0626 TaxID=3367513 RepID=UPI00374A7648